MKKIKEKYAIEFLIYRIFLKHVKLHGMYRTFRCSVNYNNNSRDIIHLLCRMNPYYNDNMGRLLNSYSSYIGTRSYEDILSIMRESCGGRITETNDGKNQMAIMNAVNGLIHSCLEYGIRDGNYQILGKIGEDIFTEVCKTLFGDEFTDKTSEMLSPEQTKMMERMGGMIPPPMGGGRRPQMDRDFLNWLKEQHRILEQERATIGATPRTQATDNVHWDAPRDIDWEYMLYTDDEFED